MKNQISQKLNAGLRRVFQISFMALAWVILSGQEVLAQNKLQEAKGAWDDNIEIVMQIFAGMLNVFFAAGILGVVAAYVFNNQQAKDHAVKFIIALVVGGIGTAVFF